MALSALCGIGCGQAQQAGSVLPPTASRADASLGAGDSFEVTVYGQKDLSGKYRVGPDGTINFPLVGEIAVEGKDQSEIARTIQGALAEGGFLKRPHVSVNVLEMEAKRVTVVGAVQKPGSFPHTRGMTIVHAISIAGGFTSLAARNETILTRQNDGALSRTKIPVERVTEGRAEDPALQPGDIVYVPERIF